MSIKPTQQTERKRQREREPDLVDRIFGMLVAERPELAARLTEIKAAIRRDVGGERLYIRQRDDVSELIFQRFNGRNATEVARELGVSRAWVYRVLRRPGRS